MVYIGYRQLVFCVHKSEIEKKGTQISKKVPMGTWAPKRGPIVEQWRTKCNKESEPEKNPGKVWSLAKPGGGLRGYFLES